MSNFEIPSPFPDFGGAAFLQWYNRNRKIILKYKLESMKWMNRFYCEITNVPINVSVHYTSPDGTLRQMTNRAGEPIQRTLWPEATKDRRGRMVFDKTKFVPFQVRTNNIEATSIELHIDRDVPYGKYDRTTQKQANSYAVTARNVEFTLEVANRDEVPPLEDEDVTLRSPLGHIERLLVEDWDASKAVDGSRTTYWQCEPQPSADAIVPLYIDVRDQDGEARLIDRMEMVPVYTGPSCNVYYSNDETDTNDFITSQRRIVPEVDGNPSSVENRGILFTADDDGMIINNDDMRLRLERDWTVGLLLRPSFAFDDSQDHVIWSMDTDGVDITLQYVVADSRFVLWEGATAQATGPTMAFAAEDPVIIVAGRKQGVGWYLGSAEAGATYDWNVAVDADATTDSLRLDSLYIGRSVDGLATAGAGHISDFWVRQEAYDPIVAEAFFKNRRRFILKTGPRDKTRGDWNAVLLGRLRQDMYFYVGPSWDTYDLKEWTPVFRDFTVRKGIIDLPPVKAKYIKLEFSDLVPRPYPLWEEGIRREVRTYPQWVHAWYGEVEERQREVTTYKRVKKKRRRRVETGGLRVTSGITGNTTTWFGDSAVRSGILNRTRVDYEDTGRAAFDPADYGNYSVEKDYKTVTSSRYKTVATKSIVSDLVGITQKKKFFRTVRHQYDVREVEVTHQQAYFVGLRDLKFHRVDHSTAMDSPSYLETFGDETIIDTGATTMTKDPVTDKMYALNTGDVMQTVVLESHSQFQALQLAAIATDYESQFGIEQIDLADTDHLELLTNTAQEDVTDAVVGAGAGKVLQYTPTAGGSEYGVRTVAGIYQVFGEEVHDIASDVYDTGAAYDAAALADPENLRLTAVARVRLPETSDGTYVLRIRSTGSIIAEREFSLPPRKWVELEVIHLASSGDVDLQVEIAQIDTAVSEPFAVDMLAIFQNALHWELSNDAGVTFHSVNHGIGDPNAFIRLPAKGDQLVVRATALRPGIWIQAFEVIPYYIGQDLRGRGAPTRRQSLGVNESDDWRPTADKPLFQIWSRPWPRHFSLHQANSSTFIAPVV